MQTALYRDTIGQQSQIAGMNERMMLSRLFHWFRSLREIESRSNGGNSLGARGERAAEKLLKSKGYRIIERSARTSFGEIDLIALDNRTIVFVEVKTRVTTDEREPFEAVNHSKQKQLTKLALAYLKKNQLLEHPTRFDIVGVNWPHHMEPTLRHYPNAFEPTDRGQMFS